MFNLIVLLIFKRIDNSFLLVLNTCISDNYHFKVGTLQISLID